jgi:NADP-dependent 3-hydroxy acid dehydrogenase YdfG
VHAEEGRPYDPGRLIQPADVASVVVHSVALPRTVQVSEIRLLPTRRL